MRRLGFPVLVRWRATEKFCARATFASCDGIVVLSKLASLRRFKDDVREVASGYECGIGIERFNDLKIGDQIEAFEMREIERS